MNATTATDDATVDHQLHPTTHVITSVRSADDTDDTLNSPTPTYASSAVDSGNSDEQEREDEPIGPTPFVFKSYHLASLIDPKNIGSLEATGGIRALLVVLATNPASGLRISGTKSKPGDTSTVVTSASEEFTYQSGAYTGTVENRQRVYGSNVLPIRKSKSLLEIIWLTLKGKVLVSLCYFGVH